MADEMDIVVTIDQQAVEELEREFRGKLFERVAQDEAFRQRFAEDPEQAMREAGLTAELEQRQEFKQLSESLEQQVREEAERDRASLERLLERVSTDEAFRAQLIDDPQSALAGSEFFEDEEADVQAHILPAAIPIGYGAYVAAAPAMSAAAAASYRAAPRVSNWAYRGWRALRR